MIIRKIRLLILILFIAISCKDDTQYTGNLVVTGSDRTENSVGLFDIGVLYNGQTWPEYALAIKTMTNGRVEFDNLNPGNYVIAIIYSDDPKAVQVRVGQTTTIDLFD